MTLNERRIDKSSFSLSAAQEILGVMGVRPIYIFLPMVFAAVIASLEAASLGLLLLLVKGVASNSFAFVRDVPVVKDLMRHSNGFLFPSGNRDTDAFLVLVVLVFGMVVLKNALGYFNVVLAAYWHGRFKLKMYGFVFDRFLTFGKLYFDRVSQGYLLTVLNYSEYVLRILGTLETSINQLFMFGAYLAVMLFISWKLALVTVIIFPLFQYLQEFIISRLKRTAKLTNEAYLRLSKNVFNILTCMPLVQAYTHEDKIREEYYQANENLRTLNLQAVRLRAMTAPLQEVVTMFMILSMFSIAALLFAYGKISEMSVLVIFFYAAKKSLPLFNTINLFRAEWAQAAPPIQELRKLFDDADKFVVPQGRRICAGLSSGIEFKRLNFFYIPGKRVLNDLSVLFKRGAMTAIVGPSGSGKTTMVSLIVRFYDCPPGTVFVDGTDIRDFTLRSLRQNMALVSQEVFLLNDTLRHNIIFGLDRNVGEEELISVVKKARLYDFIKSLPQGFETEVGDRGVKLSGGEKQRLAIARALLKGAPILILDEATSSLDSVTERLIQEAIREAAEDRTVIVIAHRLSTIKDADKIVVLENGCNVEQGSLAELLERKGKFFEYWEAQKFY